MRTLFSPIHVHGTQFRQGQYVTVDGRTAKVIGWRSRGYLGKMILVQITGKDPKRGKVYAFAPRDAAQRLVSRPGNKGRGSLVRVA